jgi:hypothetical protein
MTYSEKMKDPRWQRKRLEVFERDEWCCQVCCDDSATLNVHHRYYLNNKEPWEYPNEALITLCEDCHNDEKNNYPEQIDKIILSLKKHFLSDELSSLVKVFENLTIYHTSEVFVSVVKYHLLNKKNQIKMIDDYFKYLADETGKKDDGGKVGKCESAM